MPTPGPAAPPSKPPSPAEHPLCQTNPPTRRAPSPSTRACSSILVCPLTKGPLEYDRAHNELISRKAGLAYPIRDGIPIMLADEARKLDA